MWVLRGRGKNSITKISIGKKIFFTQNLQVFVIS